MRAGDVLGRGGLLEAALPGHEHRPSQLRMAELVERVLDDHGVSLIEAGTGTGKTLAYLAPAVLSGRRVVISTGTRTLQDQILEHDVPLLARALGRDLPVVSLKGLSNYLCLRRYDELLRSPEADARPEIARFLPVLSGFRANSLTGDRAELDGLPEDAPVWAAVQSGSETRIGPRCAHFESCFVTRARRRAEQAQVVVVNHHLFFADLALRAHGGGVIPAYDAVIFDEAHQLEDIATTFFGVQLSETRIEALVRDAERALRAAAEFDLDVERVTHLVLLRASELFGRLPRGSVPDGGRASLSSQSLDEGARDALFALDLALEELAGMLRERAATQDGASQCIRRAESMRTAVGTLAEPGAGHIAWTQQRGRALSMGASPVDVSSYFRDEVLHRVRSVVLTSATLSTSGTLAFTRSRLGIDFEVDEAMLPSPFDYPTQAALYLPALPDPRVPAFAAAAADEIVALVALTGGGAFVLCTSLRAMNDLAKRARALLQAQGVPVMVQGEDSKSLQLERFRQHGHAVLFATQSFWEGVDVPGDALRLVIIDKLPFEVPSDPLVEARCARLEAAGSSAFMEYLVPSAALALKQGFGRLIRTATDRGIVALLDPRVRTKGYGKVFLRSLPEARRCTTLDEVRAFWDGAPPAAP